MCKLGILAIGADLYYSAFRHFKTLVFILQHQQQQLQPGISRKVIDLLAHFIALMTLILTWRGRVNRQTAGRIVLPVIGVQFMIDLLVLQQNRQKNEVGKLELNGLETLWFLKSVLFLTIVIKLAIGKDRSYVACGEWFPRRSSEEPSPVSEFYVHEETPQSEADGKKNANKHREKKRK